MIACDLAGASVAIGHPDVNVQLSQEPSRVNGDIWDELQSQLDDVARHLQLLRLESVRCQVRMHSFRII